MTDEQILILRNVTEAREGRKHHMYLDTIGLVTVGIGHMLPSPEAAAALPFLPPGRAAADWTALKLEPFGYDYTADFFARLTVSRLPDEAVNALFAATARKFIAQLEARFPHMATWPWPAQQATFDMIYSMGWPRLSQYAHMLPALDRQDFRDAAVHCFRHGWRDTPEHPNKRNQYTRDLYLQAAVGH